MGKSTKLRTFILWFLAVAITLASVIYQRLTGPTHPVRGKIEINEQIIKYKLLRSHDTTADAVIKIAVSDTAIKAIYKWKRFKSHDVWTVDTLIVKDNTLLFVIPKQPAAGKVMYQILLIDGKGRQFQLSEEPVVIRFKGAVPKLILWPHILFMFVSMFLGTRTGVEAVFNGNKSYRFALWTTVLLFLGGLILGPIVQKFAFGAFWTGWPIGHDLTDNKTAFSFIFWALALWQGKKEGKGRGWFIIAAVVQLAVYLVPHSVLGSEFDYTGMK